MDYLYHYLTNKIVVRKSKWVFSSSKWTERKKKKLLQRSINKWKIKHTQNKHSEMICSRWNLKFLPRFKFDSEKSMADFNQKNLSQISMIKMVQLDDSKIDDPFQIVVENKIRSKKSHNFVYSFLPMYYFARFFGLLPFSFVYNSNGEVEAPRIRIFDAVWFVISVTFYLILAINSCHGLEIPNDSAPLVTLSNSLLLTCGLFNGATMIVVNMCIRFRFVAILKTFTNFDKDVSQKQYFFYIILTSTFFLCVF